MFALNSIVFFSCDWFSFYIYRLQQFIQVQMSAIKTFKATIRLFWQVLHKIKHYREDKSCFIDFKIQADNTFHYFFQNAKIKIIYNIIIFYFSYILPIWCWYRMFLYLNVLNFKWIKAEHFVGEIKVVNLFICE